MSEPIVPSELPMIEKAMLFAQEKHQGQYRKTRKIPYFWHVISVAKNVERFKKSKNIEMLQVAALLHDTVEDCGVTLVEISEKFGYKVASIVDELTTDKNECKKVGKTQYLINKLSKMSSYGVLIKLCDRLDNISDLDLATSEFRQKYVKETNEILDFVVTHVKVTRTHASVIQEIRSQLSKYN